MQDKWYYCWNLPGCLPDFDTPICEGMSFEDAKEGLLDELERFADSEADSGDSYRMELWDSTIAEIREWRERDCPNYTRGPDGYHYCLDTLE
jgi:hypothetical protein